MPAWKVIDLLEYTDLKKQHEQHERAFHDKAEAHEKEMAKLTGKSTGLSGIEQAFASEADPDATGPNPKHREDFMRLVNAAARKPPREG